jgi:hypothetical protein
MGTIKLENSRVTELTNTILELSRGRSPHEFILCCGIAAGAMLPGNWHQKDWDEIIEAMAHAMRRSAGVIEAGTPVISEVKH